MTVPYNSIGKGLGGEKQSYEDIEAICINMWQGAKMTWSHESPVVMLMNDCTGGAMSNSDRGDVDDSQ